MPKVTLVLTGDKELDAKLAKLKSADAKRAFRKAARATIKPFKEDVKQALPSKSGALKKSTKVRSMKRSRQAIGVRVSVDAVPYGRFVLLGTKRIKGRRTIRNEADKQRASIQRKFGKNLGREILNITKG